MKLQIKIMNKKIGSEIPMPVFQTSGSAGLDLRACLTEDLLMKPNDKVLVGTGIAIFIGDTDYAAMILPRSGLGHKHGIILGNTVGLIDSDYQGELMVSCWNRGNKDYKLAVGERFAQLIFTRVCQPEMIVVDDFKPTQRGQGGFGSTGSNENIS